MNCLSKSKFQYTLKVSKTRKFSFFSWFIIFIIIILIINPTDPLSYNCGLEEPEHLDIVALAPTLSHSFLHRDPRQTTVAHILLG